MPNPKGFHLNQQTHSLEFSSISASISAWQFLLKYFSQNCIRGIALPSSRARQDCAQTKPIFARRRTHTRTNVRPHARYCGRWVGGKRVQEDPLYAARKSMEWTKCACVNVLLRWTFIISVHNWTSVCVCVCVRVWLLTAGACVCSSVRCGWAQRHISYHIIRAHRWISNAA